MNFIEVTCSLGSKVSCLAMPASLGVLVGGVSCVFGVQPKNLSHQRQAATSVETSVELSVKTAQGPFKTPEAILALLSAQPTMTLSQVAKQL